MQEITILLLAGWAAAIAAMVAILAKGFSRPAMQIASVSVQHIANKVPDQPPATPHSEPLQQPSSTIAAEAVLPLSVATAASEAPPPFPEDAQTSSQTPIPTDISAVTNIANPAGLGAPALVVPIPKRRTRTKRLPTDGAPRRKRTPRAKPIVQTPSTVEQSPLPEAPQRQQPDTIS
jgi:hypothetical protein